jgi:hypothetical protein
MPTTDERPIASGAAEEMLAAAGRAPSSHNSQPWDLRWSDGTLVIRGDPRRALTVADPDGRELRLACAAALVNARTVARARGYRPSVTLLPDQSDPWLFGQIRLGPEAPPSPLDLDLAAAVWRRRTDRGAFQDVPIARQLRHRLCRAARREQSWLVFVDEPVERRRLRDTAGEAHRTQWRDPAFRAEWSHWIGHDRTAGDGLPTDPSRRAPAPDGRWRLRDYGASPEDEPARPEAHVEPEPTIAVVATFHDTPLAQLRAGMAMQVVLLTAATRGAAASFVTPPLEIPEHRERVRTLLGSGLWPQMVLRLGYGGAGMPPRRPTGSTAPPTE